MQGIRRTILVLGVAVGLCGCKAKGTCVITNTSESSAIGDACWLDYYEEACTASGDRPNRASTFYEEDAVAGMARCKADGFVEPPAPEPGGETKRFVRPSRPK